MCNFAYWGVVKQGSHVIKLYNKYHSCAETHMVDLLYSAKSLTTTHPYLQISFANTEATLSDSTTYKNFLRVTPNKLDMNYLWISFLQNYNWTRVGLLFQDASVGASSYAYVRNEFAEGRQSFYYVLLLF